jgi:methanogenic corrinoid protein MtbC1
MWDCDDCDFSEVTLGVLRLTHAVQSLEGAGETRPDAATDRPGILLAQAPGGQHGLGLAILAQFFSRAGWDVRCETVANSGKLAGIVRQHRFGVVGLSVACTDQVDSLAATIRELRRASANRRLGIMVGGAAFAADPGLAVRIGADATASDGQSAVIEAQRLISPIARAR